MSAEPRIESFVIRFVYDQPDGDKAEGSNWHSIVRHVQSDTERRFSSWPEMVAFIGRYVELEAARKES